MHFEGCNFRDDEFIDHTCNLIEDIEDYNCKTLPNNKTTMKFTKDYKEEDLPKVSHQRICKDFDNIQISCMAGICKNISSVYQCTFDNILNDIENEWSDDGFCHCQNCYNESVTFSGTCNKTVSICNNGGRRDNRELCENIPDIPEYSNECASCRAICHQRGQCFDMRKRRDPTKIGTDEFGIPELKYYTCNKGQCEEIYNLKCKRRCNELNFDMNNKNAVIVHGERIIMAECSSRTTAGLYRLNAPRNTNRNTLFAACSNVTIDKEGKSMKAYDCVNGTWIDSYREFNGGFTNYSNLMDTYGQLREDPGYRSNAVHYEEDITIYNRTQLRVNIQGCVNTLSEECTAFYQDYGKDGRNYTARAIYKCYYDPENPDFVVINFNPSKTLMLLILFASIPGGIMVLSCCYMCGCSKFIYTPDDGHMRLKCCGKYVTGIGHVPPVFERMKNADA